MSVAILIAITRLREEIRQRVVADDEAMQGGE